MFGQELKKKKKELSGQVAERGREKRGMREEDCSEWKIKKCK